LDCFVTKLNTDGNALLYSTYLGGSHIDKGRSIAVDDSGCAYVTGTTESSDFPTQSPYQGSSGGGPHDCFVTKLNDSGSALSYSTYLGGNSYDYGNGIAVDDSGCAYVTGSTFSSDFPINRGWRGEGWSCFVMKLNSNGHALIHASIFLGGSGNDHGTSIAVDDSGCAYVTGETNSSDFPAWDLFRNLNGSYDCFVTKLSRYSGVVYSTYLGGNDYDSGKGIAVDDSGCAYVTGVTHSSDFPTESPLQGSRRGVQDCFVTKLNSEGDALVYSTYLGGNDSLSDPGMWDIEPGRGIAVDNNGWFYVTGYTGSSDFPTESAFQGSHGGAEYDCFIAKLPSFSASISSVTPSYGPPDGGNEVTITGEDFFEGMAVTFGGIPATNVQVSETGYAVIASLPIDLTDPAPVDVALSITLDEGGGQSTGPITFSTHQIAGTDLETSIQSELDAQFGQDVINAAVDGPDTAAVVTFTTAAYPNSVTLEIEQTAGTDVLFPQIATDTGGPRITAVVPAFDIGSEEHVIVEVAVGLHGLTGDFGSYVYTTLGTGTLTVSFRTGLNVVSLPLQPDTPFTAKTFAEHIGDVTLILHHDSAAQEFSAYLPAHDTHDGFPIQGGEGYIVNVTADKDVDFTGRQWDNGNAAPRRDEPLSVSDRTTWAFVAAGQLPPELGDSEALIITARNVERDLSCKVLPSTGRKFRLMFVDLSRNPVVAAGEQLEVTFADRGGNVLSEGRLTVKTEDIDKAFVVIRPSDISLWTKITLPDRTELLQNYPNPFNPETWIPFQLSEPADVTISIYDISGRLVRTIVPGVLPAGTYVGKDQASYWNGKNQAGEETSSGIYFYRINAGKFNAVRRMVLLK